jgi:hypothetical protein
MRLSVIRLTVNPVAAHSIIAPATTNGSNNAMRAVVVVALTAEPRVGAGERCRCAAHHLRAAAAVILNAP